MTKHKYNKYSIPQLNHHSPQSRHSGPLGQVLPASRRRWYSSSQKHAFTIIEVVLVLAIAGLIFLMVFIALPALQRNQRDAQRKQDLSAMLDGYERCRANNRGQCNHKSGTSALYNQTLVGGGYINTDEIRDPSTGQPYMPLYASVINDRLEIGRVLINTGAYCRDGGNMVDYPGRDHPKAGSTIVFVVRLEGGGTTCASNENK